MATNSNYALGFSLDVRNRIKMNNLYVKNFRYLVKLPGKKLLTGRVTVLVTDSMLSALVGFAFADFCRRFEGRPVRGRTPCDW
jgi:hypothetical protein